MDKKSKIKNFRVKVKNKTEKSKPKFEKPEPWEVKCKNHAPFSNFQHFSPYILKGRPVSASARAFGIFDDPDIPSN